jgi:hypothetical protein
MTTPQVLQVLGSFLTSVTTKILSDSKVINSVFDKTVSMITSSSKPVLQNAETQYLQGKARREQELVAVQERLASIKELEVNAGMAIAAQEVQLKMQDLEQQRERLQQGKAQQQQVAQIIQLRERELQLLEEEQAEQRKLSLLHLELVQKSRAEQIDLRLQEIQARWDQEHWSGVLSREEMRKILLEGREQ